MVDHYAPSSPEALIRPWRTATMVAVGFAAIELLVLAGLGAVYFGKRWFSDARVTAGKPAVTKPYRAAPVALTPQAPEPHAQPMLTRAHTTLLVLNGNGQAGAAGAEARVLRVHGYKVAAVGNAKRSDYARSMVLYRPGYEREAQRLAHDVRIPIVSVLDGVKPGEIKNAKLAIILGGS